MKKLTLAFDLHQIAKGRSILFDRPFFITNNALWQSVRGLSAIIFIVLGLV
jgi:hypothetical protein